MIMAMVAVAGCGSSTPKQAASSAQNGKKITIGFSVSTQNNPFFVTMAKSVEEQAKKDGITVKIVDAQNDPAKQANDITDLIESKVDVL